MTPPLIQLKDVTKRFGDRTILDRVNISLHEGETTTIIGKSGVGKSVTLKHIIGLLEPDDGEIRFAGRPLKDMNRHERRDMKGQFSYMFQNNALFDSMTVHDNIALPLIERNRVNKSDARRKVQLMIDQLELSEVVHQYPSQLSGGMQKRVALARALITKPKIILFDEPTTGLDPVRKNSVLGMIAHYRKQFGFTAIIVSHDIPDIFFISDRIAIIYDGRAIFQGSPFELETFDHPYTNEFVRSLVSLKDELTGLETKRSFERQYAHEFGMVQTSEEFTVVLFTIEDPDTSGTEADTPLIQAIIPTLASLIDKQIGSVGISSRYSRNEILCVLPHTDAKRVTTFVEELAIELQTEGAFSDQITNRSSPGVSVLAGVAYGKPGVDLDALVTEAKSSRKALI